MKTKIIVLATSFLGFICGVQSPGVQIAPFTYQVRLTNNGGFTNANYNI